MALYDFSAHCQPDSRAGVLATAVETLEHREDPVQILLLEPDTVVPNREHAGLDTADAMPIDGPALYRDQRGYLGSVKLERVADQVLEELRHLGRIRLDHREVFDADLAASLLDEAAEVGDDFSSHGSQVDELELLAPGPYLRVGEQVVNQSPHSLHRPLQTFQIIPTPLIQVIRRDGYEPIGESLHLPQRLLQVVCRNGREFFELLVASLQLEQVGAPVGLSLFEFLNLNSELRVEVA